MNARSYLTDVPSIRCWRRDRRSESTFASGDDERAVTEELLSNKPKTDRRKVDVRLRCAEATVNYSDERQLYDGRSSAYSKKTPRLRVRPSVRTRGVTKDYRIGRCSDDHFDVTGVIFIRYGSIDEGVRRGPPWLLRRCPPATVVERVHGPSRAFVRHGRNFYPMLASGPAFRVNFRSGRR